jgi:hypothetical protein
MLVLCDLIDLLQKNRVKNDETLVTMMHKLFASSKSTCCPDDLPDAEIADVHAVDLVQERSLVWCKLVKRSLLYLTQDSTVTLVSTPVLSTSTVVDIEDALAMADARKNVLRHWRQLIQVTLDSVSNGCAGELVSILEMLDTMMKVCDVVVEDVEDDEDEDEEDGMNCRGNQHDINGYDDVFADEFDGAVYWFVDDEPKEFTTGMDSGNESVADVADFVESFESQVDSNVYSNGPVEIDYRELMLCFPLQTLEEEQMLTQQQESL